eukprot:scaffold59767_cov34-Phaeocystis_antarctica.AAC.3
MARSKSKCTRTLSGSAKVAVITSGTLVHEDLPVAQRLEAAQQGVRLPPPVARAPAATRRTVSLDPGRRQVLERQVRAGGDDRPRLRRPAALHSRQVSELTVTSEGGGVPRRVFRADCLPPAPVLPCRLPVEDRRCRAEALRDGAVGEGLSSTPHRTGAATAGGGGGSLLSTAPIGWGCRLLGECRSLPGAGFRVSAGCCRVLPG